MTRNRAHHLRLLALCIFAALLALLAGIARGAPAVDPARFKDVKIISQELAPGVYMLVGDGGNIAASVGPDGTLIVDNQFAPLAKRIQKALRKIDGGQPRLIVNTHFHFDHTGGNEAFGTDGVIVAHDNVRVRIAGDADLARAARPLVTYEDRLRLHFNDDAIDLIHLPAGHTDGDSFVWFREAGVAHLGDHFFKDRFPFVDLNAGGSVEGYLHNLETVIRLLPDDTQIIPGHGELATLADLARKADMIRSTHRLVRDALAAGQSSEQILAAGLGDRWASWGAGFINEARWIQTLLKNAGVAVSAE